MHENNGKKNQEKNIKKFVLIYIYELCADKLPVAEAAFNAINTE